MDEYEKIRQRKREEYRKRHRAQVRRKQLIGNGIVIGVIILIIATIIIVVALRGKKAKQEEVKAEVTSTLYNPIQPKLDVQLLTPNPYSRPQKALEKVNGIVVHYTANPGTSARQNRDYFNGLAETKKTKASSHFVIGLEGEIVQCIPCNEISYASNNRNSDTISIECCIEDETGKFNDSTYQSLIELTTWLMGRYDLSADDVIRHYDVTGKKCPLYFVEHEDAWEQFHKDLDKWCAKGRGKPKLTIYNKLKDDLKNEGNYRKSVKKRERTSESEQPQTGD